LEIPADVESRVDRVTVLPPSTLDLAAGDAVARFARRIAALVIRLGVDHERAAIGVEERGWA
jgi:hypothetical protein